MTTPRPLPGLVRRDVMVETWEAGRGVAHYIRQPDPHLNGQLVALGVDTYLKMLLQVRYGARYTGRGTGAVRARYRRGRAREDGWGLGLVGLEVPGRRWRRS